MKKYIFLIEIALIAGCSGTIQRRIPVAPQTPFEFDGARVYSPNESGWFLAHLDKKKAFFGKHLDNPMDSAYMYVLIGRIEEALQKKECKNKPDLMDCASELMDYVPPEQDQRQKKIHYASEKIQIKNTSCLKYDWLGEDHKSSGLNSINFQYIGIKGYFCIHPFDSKLYVKIEYSHRSKDRAFPKNLNLVGEHFFSDLEFVDFGD